jgi:hypothetical protein
MSPERQRALAEAVRKLRIMMERAFRILRRQIEDMSKAIDKAILKVGEGLVKGGLLALSGGHRSVSHYRSLAEQMGLYQRYLNANHSIGWGWYIGQHARSYSGRWTLRYSDPHPELRPYLGELLPLKWDFSDVDLGP